MTITTVFTRKLGADDIAFGRGSYTYYNSVTGVVDSVAAVNASHIPFADSIYTVQDLIDGGGDVTLYLGDIIARAPVVDARAYGAVGLRATIDAAIAGIGSDNRTLYLSPGTWVGVGAADSDLTIPSNINLWPDDGAIISIATGKTLTIDGPIFAGPHQIFSCTGTGNVTFATNDAIISVWANWWGVDSGSSDNSAALKKAIDALIKGGIIRFPHGVYTFTAAVVDDEDIPDNIAFEGAGWREYTDTYGTVLKYTASSGYLFDIVTIDGVIRRGNWRWKDLKIYLTDASADGAIKINDITDSNPDSATTGCYAVHCRWENVCIKGTASAGSDAPDGITAFALYSGLVDENCYFEYLRRAIWLRDSDGNKLYPRVSYCNASIYIVGSSLTYSNNNEITGMYHNCLDYGDPQYVFFDSGNKTIIRDTQVEADTGDTPFYLNGAGTTLMNLRCARYGTNPTYAGTIGPAAINIRFINCSGMFGSFSEASWPQFNVDDTGFTYPYNKYLDRAATFIDCDGAFLSMVPAHPRLRIVGLKNANFPEPAGNTGDMAKALGARDCSRDEIRSVALGSRGMGELERVDFYGHALSNNFVASHYGTNCMAEYVVDANARHGYAIKLTSILNGDEYSVAFPLLVGRDVGTTDVIYWEVSSRLTGAVAAGEMVVQIWNVTQDVALSAENIGVHTTFDVKHGYERLNATDAAPGDLLLVEFYNNTDVLSARDMHISYCYGGPVPRIAQALRPVTPRQTITYAAAITPDITLGNYVFCDIAANAAITINAPAAADRIFGERITFELENAANACTITWGAGYQALTTNITASKTIILDFIYNGTNYVQVNSPAEVTTV